MENRIYGARSERVAKKIGVGDCVVFYIKRSMELRDLWIVDGLWEYSDKPLWPDELEDNRVIYKYRVALRNIRKGSVAIYDVVNVLSFIRDKNNWQLYFKGPRPIDTYDLIKILEKYREVEKGIDLSSDALNITQPIAVERSSHREIQDLISYIGDRLGYHTVVEYSYENRRYDVVWFMKASHIFEVVLSRNRLRDALSNLAHAYRYLNIKRLFLVVGDESLKAEAERELNIAFENIKDSIDIITVSELRKTVDNLEDIRPELLFRLFSSD